MSDHLKLPFYEGEYKRKVQDGGRIGPRSDRKGFSEVQIFNLGGIKRDFERDKERFKQFFDPNLIFKIELNQSVDEEEFIKFLARNEIKVISPSPEGKGYWILLADDERLVEIEKKIKEYGKTGKNKKFDAISSFEPIPLQEKIGEQLHDKPLQEGEESYLDVEIWRMEDEELEKFLDGFKQLIISKGGQVTDELKTENLCLIRAKINKSLFDEIIVLREINRIDRPPKPYITYQMLSTPLEELSIEGPPDKNATAVALLDSGILSNHPLLEKAVGDEIAIPTLSNDKIQEDKPQDDVGHGTKVAGVVLYGDIRECINNKRFQPEVWILSAKIMFKEENPITGEITTAYDESELLEHQLERAVRYFVKNFSNCKVINISFGDRHKKMFGNKRQFALATLIDELAKELDIVFVISAGNLSNPKNLGFPEKYPFYLIDEKEDVKIIDPASSAYAITVGSVSQQVGPSNIRQMELFFSPVQTNHPSPFTRVGLGYKGMIKPELIEEGGNIIYSASDSLKMEDIGGKLIVLNPQWIEEGRLFTVDYGTSFSAPRISHYIAKLFNQFPEYSPNLIKALLISSAEIPSDRPSSLAELTFNDSDIKLVDLLKIYGYGKPNFEQAVSSDDNHVLLIAEKKIKLDGIHLYYFYLSREFIEESGDREISVALVYNPPIRRNRIDYMGVSMEFHLFKNAGVQEILKGYERILQIKKEEETEVTVPEELKIKEIDIHPSVRLRKKCLHQKGIKIYSKKPDISLDKPLVLAVISQKQWIKKEDYLQDYAVVVKIKHKARIDLYNSIRHRIEERVKIKV
ncbi:MAG: S8 family peptidase [bacterium]